MASYKPVTHVIFDLDGTLLDTEEILTTCLQSFTKKYGKQITSSQRAQCIGRLPGDTFAFLIKELNLPVSVEDFYHNIRKGFHELISDGCKLKPGAERLVKHLYDNNIPLAIATNSPKNLYDITTKHHQDLMNCFHHSVTAGDLESERPKPAPDVFLVCARRFDDRPSPEKVLVIEDSPSGVQAAIAAGMQVVMVPDPLIDSKLCENATLVLKTLENFQPELFGLPPFANEQ